MLVQGHTPARVEQVIQETSDTRTFSLSSSPELWAQQGRVTLTIKRLPGGLVTNWLHDNLSYGLVISLRRLPVARASPARALYCRR